MSRLFSRGGVGFCGAIWWLSSSLAVCDARQFDAREAIHATALPGSQLKLVQVVFRHGARTPLTDKYWPEANVQFESGTICGELLQQKLDIAIKDGNGGPQPFSRHDARQAAKVLPGGCTKGELTLVGQQQALDLGRWLRRRYVDELGILPPQNTAGNVAARTTNYRRTIATLETALCGLYTTSEVSIPVTTASELDEILFGNAKSCEQLSMLMKGQRKALTATRRDAEGVRSLEARVHQAMGTAGDDPVSFVELHDALTTLRFHDKALPGKFDEGLLSDIEKEATHRMLAMFSILTSYQEMVAPSGSAAGEPGVLRLCVGRLAGEIMQRIDAAAAGEAQHKLYAYSGHDTTIMPLLRALGLDVDHWPGYCSNLVFEYWETLADGSGRPPAHLVRVLYNGELLRFPGTDEDGVIELRQLRNSSFGSHALDANSHSDLCRVKLEHEGSMPQASEAGDAVQGL